MHGMKIMRTIILMAVISRFMWAQVQPVESGTGTLSGVVLDERGAPIANAQVLYRTVPRIVRRLGGGWNAVGPLLGASVKTGADGSFVVTGLPAAQYHVCAYGVKPTHLGSCEWQATTSVDLASSATAPLRFQIAEGTMLTFEVQDPRQQIRDLADLNSANGRLPVSGSNFAIGVWAGSRYTLAKLVSTVGPTRRYQLAIPKSAGVRLFLDTTLNVTDAAGVALPTRTPASTLAASSQGELVTALLIP